MYRRKIMIKKRECFEEGEKKKTQVGQGAQINLDLSPEKKN